MDCSAHEAIYMQIEGTSFIDDILNSTVCQLTITTRVSRVSDTLFGRLEYMLHK